MTCLRPCRYGPRPSRRVCALCHYTGPGWPAVYSFMAGTPDLEAYLRRRFSSYGSCWVPAARRQLVCKALARGLN